MARPSPHPWYGVTSLVIPDTTLIESPGDAWESAEASLERSGIPVHMFARGAWARQAPTPAPWLITLGPATAPTAALGLQRVRSRTFPGHYLWRVERFGSTLSTSEHEAFARTLAELAARLPRVLRVTAEIVSRDPKSLELAGRAWGAAGFHQRPVMRSWKRTLVVDLAQPEDAILASFSQKPRRDLRALAKLPVQVRPIDDPRWVPRMETLIDITYSRTYGTAAEADWRSRIAFAASAPLTRLIGLFRTDVEGDRSLIAFTWGCSYGDHATYAVGASERQEDINVPLLTPLLWDLMRWARGLGATWFDLGGITAGTAASGDPLGGISDFKRLLSKTEVEVAAEWELEPNPFRARVSRTISRLAGR